MESYVNFRKKENLYPITIKNKKKYFLDMLNIEHSFSGIVGEGTIINSFIMEAAQLIINSIELFEMGYFDCAYYSLRSAIDVSSTMVYLIDLPEEEKEKQLLVWKETREFPTQGRLIKELASMGNIYKDMMEKMPDFFKNAKQLAEMLNKYVHKQGLQHFYISRNHPLNQKKSRETFAQTYENYLKKVIGIVAVMRLAADPFPILLMDKDILYRCFDSITDPYTEEFADEYIGEEIIEQYKTTELYKGVYEAFINEEEKNEATFNVMKHQYIDTTKKEEILAQLHLLYQHDIVSVIIAFSCDKVIKLYTGNGLIMYFTEKNTRRTAHQWSGIDFHNFATSDEKYNQPYDEVFISVFQFRGENFFVEHNDMLNSCDIAQIEQELVLLETKLPKEKENTEEE